MAGIIIDDDHRLAYRQEHLPEAEFGCGEPPYDDALRLFKQVAILKW